MVDEIEHHSTIEAFLHAGRFVSGKWSV